jgi:hypothetical protein
MTSKILIMENKRTTEILNSLDGVKKAPAPDFFYTRLVAKMEKGTENISIQKQQAWCLQPLFVTAGLILVLALNAFVFFQNRNGETMTVVDDNEVAQQTVVDEYSLADNNIVYDLNQDR